MKKFIVLIVCFAALQGYTQTADTSVQIAKVIVHKDPRLDILGEKEAEINALFNKILARTPMGFRLQVLSTNDRELAMRTKTQLLQRFPEQKVYMLFQLPYLKLRFGNFRTRQEADAYKNQISRMLGGASIYYINERIEINPDKDSKEEDTN